MDEGQPQGPNLTDLGDLLINDPQAPQVTFCFDSFHYRRKQSHGGRDLRHFPDNHLIRSAIFNVLHAFASLPGAAFGTEP